MAHRDKSQSPEFTVGINAKRTFVDKRSGPNLQQMTLIVALLRNFGAAKGLGPGAAVVGRGLADVSRQKGDDPEGDQRTHHGSD